jgi:hypothetical protein
MANAGQYQTNRVLLHGCADKPGEGARVMRVMRALQDAGNDVVY